MHQLLRARAAGRRRVVLLRVSVQVGGAPEPPTVACEGGRATTRGARVCAARPPARIFVVPDDPHRPYMSAPPGATCPVVCSQPQLFPEISEYYYLTHGMEATDREGRLPFNGSASAGVSARNVAPRRGEWRARGVHVPSPASRSVPWRLWWVRRA